MIIIVMIIIMTILLLSIVIVRLHVIYIYIYTLHYPIGNPLVIEGGIASRSRVF